METKLGDDSNDTVYSISILLIDYENEIERRIKIVKLLNNTVESRFENRSTHSQSGLGLVSVDT
jgi:hypothetical protein